MTLVAAAPPTVTCTPAAKFAPVTVIAVPPSVVPLFGLTDVTGTRRRGRRSGWMPAIRLPPPQADGEGQAMSGHQRPRRSARSGPFAGRISTPFYRVRVHGFAVSIELSI